MAFAKWFQKLWETRTLHLHNLLYHSRELLPLSNDVVQQLLVVEEKALQGGKDGIVAAGLSRPVADAIACLRNMELVSIQCREDRLLISFEPLFSRLLQGLLQTMGAGEEERRRLDGEREALREREERIVAWENELREWQKKITEKDQLIHEDQTDLLAREKELQASRQELSAEKQYLDHLRRDLEEVSRYLDRVPGQKAVAPAATRDETVHIAQFLEQLRGQAANKEEIREIQLLQQRYRWTLDFTLAFVKTAAGHNYRKVAQYRRQAALVAQRGIADPADLTAFFTNRSYLDDQVSEVWATLGSSLKINEVFVDMYVKWSRTWGFSHEVILRACQEAYKGAKNPTLNYVDIILSRWHQAGVRTVEDGEREIAKFRQERLRGGGYHREPGTGKSGRGPFTGENVVPKSEAEARVYEKFKHI
ncbi:MAG: DnaD domain protein [Heliobacteriaceae bacterium]|nr:DnaD domain protein [Heliobacteriaceae bacterium]MDD4588234.1 DnaD domain protein [Heliobacteriaceae bacterium]